MNTQHSLLHNTVNPAVFAVKPFKNRNGSTSYRVSGWLLGERIRQNFKTQPTTGAAAPNVVIQPRSARVA